MYQSRQMWSLSSSKPVVAGPIGLSMVAFERWRLCIVSRASPLRSASKSSRPQNQTLRPPVVGGGCLVRMELWLNLEATNLALAFEPVDEAISRMPPSSMVEVSAQPALIKTTTLSTEPEPSPATPLPVVRGVIVKPAAPVSINLILCPLSGTPTTHEFWGLMLGLLMPGSSS